MMDLYYEIDDFLEDLEITNPNLTFKEMRKLLGELRRHLEFNHFNFEDHRLAILIYLAQNYLKESHQSLWYSYHRIHLVTKKLGHKTLNLPVNDHPELDVSLEEGSLIKSTDYQIEASETSETENDPESNESSDSLSDTEEIESLPEKMIALELPNRRHGQTKQVQMIFDEDYEFYQSVHGLSDEVIEEIYQKNFESDLVTSLEYDRRFITERLDFYHSIPQFEQKSEDWLKQRTGCITASALADALGKKGKQARQNLLLNKVSGGQYRTFFGNFYTHWGEKYEDMAATIYCNRLGVDLYDFGMLPHPKYKMLGASTDGITSQLINLEIKCPPSRQITGIIPKHYWMQIQLQLEVLNLPLSHFLECRIEEFEQAEDFYNSFKSNSNSNPERGIVIEAWDPSRTKQGLPARVYHYSPIDLNPDGYREWHQKELEAILDEGLIWLNDCYWYLDVYSCINVQRDFKWFQAHLDQIFEFWKEVETGREKGFESVLAEVEKNRMPKSLDPKQIPVACLLDSDSDSEKPVKKPKEVKPSKSKDSKKSVSRNKRSVIKFDLI